MKKNLYKNFYFTVIFAGLFLSGCSTITPQQLGFSAEEWKNLDKAKQQELIKNYQALNFEKSSQAKELNTTEDNTDLYGNMTAGDNSLTVKIFGGTAMLPPFKLRKTYQAVEFTIDADSCKELVLNSASSDAHLPLRTCYKNSVLSLDPSAYDLAKKNGTITFNYSPLWADGFTYHGINTDGLVRLKNANVSIRKND